MIHFLLTYKLAETDANQGVVLAALAAAIVLALIVEGV